MSLIPEELHTTESNSSVGATVYLFYVKGNEAALETF